MIALEQSTKMPIHLKSKIQQRKIQERPQQIIVFTIYGDCGPKNKNNKTLGTAPLKPFYLRDLL